MAVANRTGGQVNITMLGKNLTSNDVDIYQINITTGDPITLSSDPLSSGNYDYQTVRDRSGKIIGQVQLDEQDPSGEISFSFYEDYDFLGKEYIYGNSKNRLLNLLNGEAFKNGTDVIVPIGTNGTDKQYTARAKFSEMNKPYKFIYHNEGAFIKEVGTADPTKNGKVTMKKNPFESTFNQSHKTFSMEVMTTTGQGQVDRMFAVLAKSTAEWAEGDINQFNLTAQRGCDLFERDDFFTEIRKEEIPEGNDRLTELYVDYILTNDGTEPSESVQEGQIYAKPETDGTVKLKKYSSSAWTEYADLDTRLGTGTRIKSRKLVDSSEENDVNCFIVLDDSNKAVDFSTNSNKRYYCKVMDYNKDTAKFEEYVTAE